MKIALLLDSGTRNMVFNQKCLKRLENSGTVVINEGNTEFDSVAPLVKDADVVVTSWGNKPIDEQYLELCPNLKLLIHAAGSVKPVVSDALWKKGVRVTASANVLSMGVSETALGFTIAASKNFFAHNENLPYNSLFNYFTTNPLLLQGFSGNTKPVHILFDFKKDLIAVSVGI